VNQLSIDFAVTRRDLGMARAELSAGAEWQRRALGYVREYCATHGGSWLAEDVREFAEARGFAAPPTKKAWGPVMQQARRAGIVRAVGYAPSRASNMSPKCLWLAA